MAMSEEADWAVEEVGAADVGDRRRRARVVEVATVLGSRPQASLPQASLPQACDDPARLKAALRPGAGALHAEIRRHPGSAPPTGREPAERRHGLIAQAPCPELATSLSELDRCDTLGALIPSTVVNDAPLTRVGVCAICLYSFPMRSKA